MRSLTNKICLSKALGQVRWKEAYGEDKQTQIDKIIKAEAIALGIQRVVQWREVRRVLYWAQFPTGPFTGEA